MNEPIPDRVKKKTTSVLDRSTALNKDQLHAVLATVLDGQPYTSMIAYALTLDKKGIIFSTPRKTQKYRNILNNSRVSLLIDTRSNTSRDYMSAESLTILGNAMARGRKWSELVGVLVRKHPDLNKVMRSTETKLILVKISRCIHVTRFQTISECMAT